MAKHFSSAESKDLSTRILYTVKISFRNEGETKTFSNEGKLPEFDYSERMPSLNRREMMKEENVKNQEGRQNNTRC